MSTIPKRKKVGGQSNTQKCNSGHRGIKYNLNYATCLTQMNLKLGSVLILTPKRICAFVGNFERKVPHKNLPFISAFVGNL